MTDTTKPKRRKGNKTDEQYIEHEAVETTTAAAASAEPVEVEVEEVTPEKMLKLEIGKFRLSDTAIADLKHQYGALTITGPEDKAGYKAVKSAWSEVRSVRTGLEKRGLEIRNRIAIVTKGVKKEEDRLIEQLTPLEEDLQKKWKAIDDAKELADKQKAEEEQRQLMTRLEELVGLGMKLIDGFYRMGETISMDVATLRALPEEQYLKLKQTVEAKNKELADLQRQKDEQDQLEKDRLKKEQDDLKEKQDQLDKERKQMLAERREVRMGKMEALGYKLSTVEGIENMFFRRNAFNVAKMLELTSEHFAEFLTTATKLVSDVNQQEEKEKRDRERADKRTKDLLALGLELDGNAFIFDNNFSVPKRWPLEYLTTCADDLFAGELEAIKGDIVTDNKAKKDHEEGKEREAKALEDKKNFISASMERAGLSFSYTAQEFYWEDRNKTIKLGWNDFLPLTEPQISDKAASLTIEIEVAKKFTKDQTEQQAEKEKKERFMGMKDKERWEHTIEDLEAALFNLKPDEFQTKTYKEKLSKLSTRLATLINEFK